MRAVFAIVKRLLASSRLSFIITALVMLFLHVLLSMQSRWYGWLTDAVLAAVVCVFTPIAPLRGLLAGFFRLIMLNGSAVLHIGICLSLSAALSLAGLWVLKRKTL